MNNWQTKKLGEIISLDYGKGLTEKVRISGDISVYGSNGLVGTHNIKLVDGPGIIVGRKGSIGEVVWSDNDFWPIDTTYYIRLLQNNELRYIYFLLQTLKLTSLNKASGVPGLNRNDVYQITVKLPSITIQKQIVKKLDTIKKLQELNQKEIEKAEELFNSLLNINLTKKKEWKEFNLEDLCTVTSSKRIYVSEYVSQGIPFFRSKEIVELANNREIKTELFISLKRFNELKSKFGAPQQGDILMTAIGTIGEIYMVKVPMEFYFKDGNVLWLKNFKKVYSSFLKFSLKVVIKKLKQASSGSAYKALTIDSLKKIIISIPPSNEQKRIVSEFEMSESNTTTLIKQKQLLTELFESTLNKLMKPIKI